MRENRNTLEHVFELEHPLRPARLSNKTKGYSLPHVIRAQRSEQDVRARQSARNSIAIAPVSVADFETPAVGIFWLVDGILVIDRSPLDPAERYGDCLTHPAGHYDCWEEWRRLGATRLAKLGYPVQIAMTEYDEWPRGRIVYEITSQQFVFYADRRLHDPKVTQTLKSAFGLTTSKITVRSDAHYRLTTGRGSHHSTLKTFQ